MWFLKKICSLGINSLKRIKLLGVLKRLSERSRVPVCWIRIAALLMMLVIGFWPSTALYLIIALVMRNKSGMFNGVQPKRPSSFAPAIFFGKTIAKKHRNLYVSAAQAKATTRRQRRYLEYR